MRVAQVAPLYESVPPQLYGGTERVVYHLTEQLVQHGHDVTLFASGDSESSAKLRPMCGQALRLQGKKIIDPLAHHVRMIEIVAREARHFDVVHFHIDYLHFPVSRAHRIPALTTLHGRLDIPELVPLYREFGDMHLVSISDNQRAPLRWANWAGTVYHGFPENLFNFNPTPGRYLAFLGRFCPEKRPDRAIEIAKRAGIPLKIAAKIDPIDQEYFETQIRGLLDHPLIEYVGEIGESEKNEFLGNALALLFPIDWAEPFGLAMIEALACGTPVIAWPQGSVPEIIEDGVSGFLVDEIDLAAKAVERLDLIDRAACRRIFEQRFSARRMAANYLKIYERLLPRRRERMSRPGALVNA